MAPQITFFGTNNHNFGSDGLDLITTPIGFAAAGIKQLSEDVDAAPVNHTLNNNNSTEVAQFTAANGIGGSTYGKATVTIAQTSDFAGRKLYLQYFKKDGTTWTKSGPHIVFDGGALQNGDVTATAASGMGIAAQTGIMIRAYYTGLTIPEPEPEPEVEYSIVQQPSNGTATINGDQVTYTPNTDFHGADSFTYKVTVDGVDSDPATVNMTVNSVNVAPTVASSISNVTVSEDAANMTINLTDKFSDLDGDSLTLTASSNRDSLVTAIVTNGTDLILNFQENQHGDATITVTATDGSNETATQIFTVTVTSVNDAPTGAVTISGQLKTGGTLFVTNGLTGDVDGMDNVVVAYQWQRNGEDIAGATGNTFQLANAAVNENAYISVVASYLDNDGHVNNVTSTSVGPVTDGVIPVIDLTGFTTHYIAKTVTNYVDPGSSAYDRYFGSHPSIDVTVDASNVTANLGTPGTYKVTFSATDAAGNTTTRERTVVIEGEENGPHAVNGYYPLFDTRSGAHSHAWGNEWHHEHQLNETTYYMPNGLNMYPSNGLVTQWHETEDITVFHILSKPSYGTLKIGGTQLTQAMYNKIVPYVQSAGYELEYTPNENQNDEVNGPDSFTYKAFQNGLSSDPATVTINVTSVNDLPYFQHIESTNIDAVFGVEKTIDISGARDFESSGQLQYVLVEGPTDPLNTLAFVDFDVDAYPGSVKYTGGKVGTDTFKYKVVDPHGGETETITVTVTTKMRSFQDILSDMTLANGDNAITDKFTLNYDMTKTYNAASRSLVANAQSDEQIRAGLVTQHGSVDPSTGQAADYTDLSNVVVPHMDGDQYILSLNNAAKTWVLKHADNTILSGRMSRDGTRLMGEIVKKGGMIADTGFRVVNTNGQGLHELTIATPPSAWNRKTVHTKLQQLENNGKSTADKMAEDIDTTNDFEIDDVNDKVTVKQDFFQRFTRPTHSNPVEQKKLRREKTKQLLRQMRSEFHGQMSGRKVVMNKEDIDLRHTFRKQKVRYAAVKEMASGADGKVLDLTADLESDEGFYVDIEDLNDAVTLKLDETNSMKIELTSLDTADEDNNRYTVTRKEDGTETAETDQVPGTTYRLKQLEFVLGSGSGETDTTAPVITLVGANPQTVEAGQPYNELGATATDNYDGDLTDSIVIDATAVDTSAVNDYIVTYNVTDAAGNVADEVERTVRVVDTTVPVITLDGANPQIVEAGQPYVELGATATDNHDTNLTGLIAIDATAVDTSAVNDYTVTYNVTDTAGNVADEVERTVRVVDTTKPVITRIGGHVIDLEVTPENNNSYTDPGATVTDNHDSNLTVTTTVTDMGGNVLPNVNTALVGAYTVTYTVTDSLGNEAVPVTRSVNVVDTTNPIITVTNVPDTTSTDVTLEVHTPYTEYGATATDNYDNDVTLTSNIVVNASNVDVTTVNTYTVTYTVTDQMGNSAAQKTRTVHVVDTTKPVITLVDSSDLTLGPNQVYDFAAGATATDNYDSYVEVTNDSATSVDTSTVGTYIVTYNATDSRGNTAVPVTRTVIVNNSVSGENAVTITSDNQQDSNVVAVDDTVTISYTTEIAEAQPTVILTFGGDAVTGTINASLTNTTWTITYVANSGDTEGAVAATVTTSAGTSSIPNTLEFKKAAGIDFKLTGLNSMLVTTKTFKLTRQGKADEQLNDFQHDIEIDALASEWSEIFHLAPESPGLADVTDGLMDIDVFEEENILYHTDYTKLTQANLGTFDPVSTTAEMNKDQETKRFSAGHGNTFTVAEACIRGWSKDIFAKEYMDDVWANRDQVVGEIDGFIDGTNTSAKGRLFEKLQTKIANADGKNNTNHLTTANLTRQLLLQLHETVRGNSDGEDRLIKPDNNNARPNSIFATDNTKQHTVGGTEHTFYKFKFIDGDSLSFGMEITHPNLYMSGSVESDNGTHVFNGGQAPQSMKFKVKINMKDSLSEE